MISVEQALQLAETYRTLGQLAVAEKHYRSILAQIPTFFPAWNNLGNLLIERGALSEGSTCLRTAISLAPGNAFAHMNLATAAQLQANFQEGWEQYEWRLDLPEFADVNRFDTPRWDGTPLHGKTLLVHAEQGLGDTIHFFRYLPLLAEASGARLVFVCERTLLRLFKSNLPSGIKISERDARLPTHDAHLPLLSIPLALQRFEPVPMTEPYLHAEDRRPPTALDMDQGKLHVGVVWAGDPKHRRNQERSIDPLLLAPILRSEQVQLFSLQIGKPAPVGMTDLMVGVEDLADTAVLLAQMDLIITVDTATAHLSGALGRRVWTLLPFLPDWRWGMQSETTPWYSTMRLFRQPTPGDWDSVIKRMAEELRRLVEARAEKHWR